jgi:CubicO group peptidase (beta-lactamase class C family)
MAAEAVGMSGERLAGIDDLLRTYVEELGFAGVSVVSARRGETVYAGECGQRDREAGLPMSDDTIVRLYSTTKPITATALMTLVEDGRLALTDPPRGSRRSPGCGCSVMTVSSSTRRRRQADRGHR